MMNSILRPATASDCGRIADLVATLVRERGGSIDSDAVETTVLSCLDDPGSEILVAEAEGVVVGYVAVHWIPFPMLGGIEGYISDLIVASDLRGTGLGGRLIGEVERRARELGCVRLMLNNRLSAESYRRGFFGKSGFLERDDFASFVKRL